MKLTQIVLDNLNNEQFGVEDLSEAYGLSRSQLHKRLKKLTGKSVSQFIREIRLEEAKKLLEHEDVTASEVAYQVGFSSATYFNTRFKDYFGYPPGEVKVRASYEKNHRKNHSNEPTGKSLSTSTTAKKWLRGAIGLVLLIAAGLFLTGKKDGSEKIAGAVNEPLPLADTISNEKTIAVLPLKNWSGDPNLEYISDGMTDAIISKLAKIGAIERVVPFTSIVAYKNTNKSINEIADELKVKNILQGSFQLAGENVNVKLQMIEGGTEKQFWENEYQRTWKTNEIFELQSQVAENVAQNINVQISESEQESIAFVPTSNKEAYQLFLQATYQFNQLSINGLEQSRPLYEKAIELDSTFIEPYIGLAMAHLLSGLVWGIVPQDEAWANAKPLLLIAKEKDTKHLDVYDEIIMVRILSGLFLYEWDIETCEQVYLNTPDKTKNFYSSGTYFNLFDYIRKTGRHKIGLETVRKQFKALPELSGSHVAVACALFFQNRYPEAIESLNIGQELFGNDYFFLMESAKYYHYLGEQEKSKEQLGLFKENFVDRPPIIHWLEAIHAEMEGHSEKVKETLLILEDLYIQNVSGSPAWFLALYYCHVKDYDKAFEWLQKSYDRHEVEMTWLKEEPVLRPIKDDPRYLELYEKVGFSIVDKTIEKETILP